MGTLDSVCEVHEIFTKQEEKEMWCVLSIIYVLG
jgi:hypothetical protein